MVVIEPEATLRAVGDSMNLLNGVAERFPEAISLAAGRPAAEAARLTDLDACVDRYLGDHSDASLFQYGPTAGLLPEWVAAVLANDEGLALDAAEVVMTTGAQEAMFLALAALFGPADVLLVPDPTYVGILGAAAVAGVPVAPVDALALDGRAVTDAVEALAHTGRRARALYAVPDFQNPLGDTWSTARRTSLLDAARAHGVLVLEDSPYRIFDFDAPPPPTLAALDDRAGSVLHIGTLSKALCPGLRLGFLAWPGGPPDGMAGIVRAKSFVTVNTSPLTQSIAAGAVARRIDPPSLRGAARAARALYRTRRDALCAGLGEALDGVPGVSWARPAGGFFLRVDLPFDFDEDAMTSCARRHGVIVCPMSMFSPTGGWRRTVRLSFSATAPAGLVEGARRFGAFVMSWLASEVR